MKPTFNLLLPLAVSGVHAFDINKLMTLIDKQFPHNIAIKSADSAIGAAETAAGKLMGVQTTQNDLTAPGQTCGDVMVIFVRGTAEPGNIGSMVGPAFLDELTRNLTGKTVAFQGVAASDYSASIEDYFTGGSASGAKGMATYVKKAKTSCPHTKIVMSGYSQGAQVVHKAATLLGSQMASISSVVTFGDPDSTKAVTGIDSSKVLVICHDGDDICKFGDLLTLKHFTYAKNVPQAVAFVASHL